MLLRVDGGTRVGLGHVMRCLALAQRWLDRNGQVHAATVSQDPAVVARFRREKIPLHALSTSQVGGAVDGEETAELARRFGADWIVADGYAFDADFQARIVGSGGRLLVLDDYGHADHYGAHVVLNQNVGAAETLYPSREPYTDLLLGTRYALLRREFLQIERSEGRKRPIPYVLVLMGGSDPHNMSVRIINAWPRSGRLVPELVIVVGPSNRDYEELAAAVLRSGQAVRIAQDPADLPRLMAGARLAITAAGSTCWELSFLGVPMVTMVVATNQAEISRGVARAGAGLDLGWACDLSDDSLLNTIESLLADPVRLGRMELCGRRLVDGQGPDRVVDHLALRSAERR